MTLVKFANGTRKNGLSPLFTDVFDSFFHDSSLQDRFAAKIPAVNISESETGYHIDLAAPGLKKEDFKISLDKNVLVISSEKKNESTDEGKAYSRREYNYSAFTRSFTLPELADQSGIQAEYADGVLKIDVAKKEEAKQLVREIAIR
jgi:HSP20 family protein